MNKTLFPQLPTLSPKKEQVLYTLIIYESYLHGIDSKYFSLPIPLKDVISFAFIISGIILKAKCTPLSSLCASKQDDLQYDNRRHTLHRDVALTCLHWEHCTSVVGHDFSSTSHFTQMVTSAASEPQFKHGVRYLRSNRRLRKRSNCTEPVKPEHSPM